MDHVTALRNCIDAREGVLVIGAGVTIGATGRDDLSWPRLLARSIDYLTANSDNVSDQWSALHQLQIELGADDPSLLLTAADQIVSKFDNSDSDLFASWLRDEFSGMRIAETSLLDAIDALHIPILTTNYDTVVEEQTGRPTILRSDVQEVHEALRGHSNGVVHLHGVWNRPESIVLGATSYRALSDDEVAGKLEKAITSLLSLIFVGVGEGVDDPHFQSLMDWSIETATMAYPQHFKLQAGDPNTPSLTSPISSSGICPIGYGGHDDLPNFLTDLAPASPSVISEMTPAVNDARTVARERIREAVRDRSLFQLDTSSTGLPHMSEMLIPPVLLPTSPSAFVLSFSDDQMMNADDLLRRVDPKGIAKDGESGLIVGGSGSGVSSALAWLVAEAAGRDENVYPVIIDLSVDPQGKHPVERLLRDQLRLAGLALGKRDDLPPVALGIDNLTAGPKVLERVAADLDRLELDAVYVGTTPVADAEVHRALLTRALMPRYYIGQLAYNDIEAMLKLADTSLPASSAAQIMDFATEQGIAKTPFSISLMANVLRQGEELASSTSQTGLLDAYAMALLGQGASSEDARLGLDAMARAAILSTIAAEFVVQSSPTLSYSRIVGVVETMLEELAWEFQVSSVIQDFCERRVLSQMGNRVRFSQTSFLWVFAAKHADKNPDFLAQLSEQPLLYSSILERYAGISRRDRSLVLSLLGMVEEEISHLVDERVGSFESTKTRLSASPIPALVGVICEDGHDPEHGSLEVGEGEGGGAAVGEDDNLGDGDENGDLSQALMDRMANSSTDQDAFLDSVSDLSPLRRVMMGLELTSIAFRDAELVMDRGYKRDVIGRLLEAWASAVDLLGADADVAEGFRREGLQLAELFEADDIAAEELVGRLSLFGPFLLGVGLMVERLSSAKLKVPLVEACREATEKRSEVLEGILVMAESLVWAIDPGQALEFAEQALGAFPSSPVLLGLMRDWETFIYLAEDGLDNYEVRLSSLIASKVVGPNDRSPAAKAQKNDVRMRLQKYRMSHARKSV